MPITRTRVELLHLALTPIVAVVTLVARIGRIVLIAALAIFTIRFAFSPLGRSAVESCLHLPNLVFHEAGHVLFLPFGRFMNVLGGSLLQVLVPLVCAGTFLMQHGNRFACAVAVWWAGESLVDLAPYIADARALRLPLIGGRTGAEVEGHDWEYLLTRLSILSWDVTLGQLAHFAGTVVMVAALAWAVGLVVQRRELDGQ